MKRASILCAFLLTVGCAPQGNENFFASKRSAVEMRAIQSRALDEQPSTVARGVIATLHDLGYRITRVDPGSGTVSATKADRLRVAAVIRAQDGNRSVVRANAVILVPPGQVYEVDSAEFYQQNFFAPLSATLGREAFAIAATETVPDAVRPEADAQPVATQNPPGAAR